MSTVRELAAESIGRITRRGLEPQLAQAEQALGPRERVVAVAHGQDGPRTVLLVVTDGRVLLSSGAPFAQPELVAFPRAELTGATAAAEAGDWRLVLERGGGTVAISGMFDRDAQRLAGVLTT